MPTSTSSWTGRADRVAPTHVLLDLDGTISDSSPGISHSLRHAFAACGLPPPSDADVRTVIGPPFEIGLPMIGIPDDALERVVDRYRERYTTIGAYENTLYDGIIDLLDRLLAAAGALPLAVGHGGLHAHETKAIGGQRLRGARAGKLGRAQANPVRGRSA